MDRSGQGGARVRVPPPAVFMGLIAFGFLVNGFVYPLSVGFALVPRLIIGGALILAGVGVGIVALRQFRRSGRANALPWHPSPRLIAEGPYRVSRNPMYLSEVAQMVGIGIVADRAWVCLFSALFLLIVHFTVVLPEERYLRETFGDAYESYRAQVRRYL
jgi:protein-S-isoprenylcysteine O-methyltransferase Ste14